MLQSFAQQDGAGAPRKYDKEAMIRLGLEHATAAELFAALRRDAHGGAPLRADAMPDWTGLWTRVGPPFYDPDQKPTELTTAKLKPAALEELRKRRELSKQGVEYDPISDCSPPGFPRFLAIPFLREFIVTPGETWMTSETVNNMRRIYTDGRGHTPAEDAYPLWYGDSIGFWNDGKLVVHTSQLRANIFHRNDPKFSDALETVEIWQKLDPETIVADVWAYDPETLEEPWFVRDTYKKVSNDDKSVRIGYWDCHENPNNVVIETEQGSSQFGDFTFDENK
ncbi:MAG TPA: hypothetical protein VFV10_15810 [Gammaproteobacteria bacterium]|nr:hypothetical protein [Gammaproteobacteria bacterium]